jgi:hypothetical protein
MPPNSSVPDKGADKAIEVSRRDLFEYAYGDLPIGRTREITRLARTDEELRSRIAFYASLIDTGLSDEKTDR